jgi:long-chain acyl-CoA synthetase
MWCTLIGILGEDNTEVPTGERGEICVRSSMTVQGYYRNPAATEELFAGGWVHTGDIGFLDPEGYLHVTGRKKLMIKSGGRSIFPEEIESVLVRHPKVVEAGVISVESRKWGEAVKALVVLKPGERCDAEELTHFCKERLAAYKAPKTFAFVPGLPRNGLGKIDRGQLRTMAAEN